MTDYVQAIQKMKDKWPSEIISRDQIGKFTGGAFTPAYMSNLDSQGKGPDGAFRFRRKVAYPIDSLIEWLINNAQSHRGN